MADDKTLEQRVTDLENSGIDLPNGMFISGEIEGYYNDKLFDSGWEARSELQVGFDVTLPDNDLNIDYAGASMTYDSDYSLDSTKDNTMVEKLMSKHPKFLLAAIFLFACLGQTQATVAAELNIYSHRQPFLIEPFLKAFTEKTGIKTNVVYASKGLVQRLMAEGEASPADVVLTVDIGRLRQYADKNLFATFASDKLLAAIPRHLRSSDNTWFGFSKRSRVIAVSKDLENQDEYRNQDSL